MIRKNMKLIIGFVIGLILTTGTVFAANSLSASSISIDKSKMSKVENSNLQSALDYLYGQSEKNNLITIESGVLHKSQTYLGIAYLDPTNLDNKCTSANSVSETGTKTGCMKWYIYKDLGDSYKMILDHNVVSRQNWNDSSEEYPYGRNLSYEDSNVYPIIQELTNSGNGQLNWDGSLKPDLIEASEIAEIVGYENFNSKQDWICLDFKTADKTNYCRKIQGTSNYAWLFDNLGYSDSYGNCITYGCNYTNTTADAGYWTKTPRGTVGTGSNVWYIDRTGSLEYHAALSKAYGVRPVITVSKSLFN